MVIGAGPASRPKITPLRRLRTRLWFFQPGQQPGIPEPKKPEPGHDLPHFVAGASKQGIHRIAVHALEEVQSQQPCTTSGLGLGLAEATSSFGSRVFSRP